MSTTANFQSYGAEKAHDGNKNTYCASMVQEGAWLRVRAELPSATAAVGRVVVWNRPESAFQGALLPFQISVGSGGAVCGGGPITSPPHPVGVGPYEVDCSSVSPIGDGEVTLTLVTTAGSPRRLAVSEIEVFAK